MSHPFLEVTIPVYNEERRLRKGIETLHRFCTIQGFSTKIVIADNGSKDRTFALSEELSREFPNVSIIRVPTKGVGAALKHAWSRSKADVIGYMDVDLSTDIRHLTKVYELFQQKKVEVLSGSRLIPGAHVIGRKVSREISSRCYNWLLQATLGCHFTDGMCGFKFLTRSAYRKIQNIGLSNNEWFFNTEILIKAEWAGLSVTEIPVRWTDDHDSKVKILELAVKYSREVLRVRRELKRMAA